MKVFISGLDITSFRWEVNLADLHDIFQQPKAVWKSLVRYVCDVCVDCEGIEG